jgi:hypothetical protein
VGRVGHQLGIGGVIGPMVTLLFLLFPDGHVPSRRWRPVAWAAGVDLVIIAVAGMVNPNADSGLPVGNPIGMEAAGKAVDALSSTSSGQKILDHERAPESTS